MNKSFWKINFPLSCRLLTCHLLQKYLLCPNFTENMTQFQAKASTSNTFEGLLFRDRKITVTCFNWVLDKWNRLPLPVFKFRTIFFIFYLASCLKNSKSSISLPVCNQKSVKAINRSSKSLWNILSKSIVRFCCLFSYFIFPIKL